MSISWAQMAAKSADLPDPGEDVKPKRVEPAKKVKQEQVEEQQRTSRKLHTCRRCNEDIEYSEIEDHLNEKHKLRKGSRYVVCPKCSFYLKTKDDVSREDALKEHHAERHFMKVQRPRPKVDNKKKSTDMSAEKLLQEVATLTE